ncbi:hypothetical protein THAOC_09086, partial [Thalassiosira oceanica]
RSAPPGPRARTDGGSDAAAGLAAVVLAAGSADIDSMSTAGGTWADDAWAVISRRAAGGFRRWRRRKCLQPETDTRDNPEEFDKVHTQGRDPHRESTTGPPTTNGYPATTARPLNYSSQVAERIKHVRGCSRRMEAAVKVAADVHVGTQRGPLSDWVARKVHFHGFAGLTTRRGAKVKSPEFCCFGHQWTVAIYPGGSRLSKEGYVAAYLTNESPESIQAYYKIILKHPTDQNERSFVSEMSGEEMVTFEDDGHQNSSGEYDFAERETMLTYLNNGTLTLEICLRSYEQAESTSFVPTNPFCGNMLQVFNNEEKSDVRFEVGGEVEAWQTDASAPRPPQLRSMQTRGWGRGANINGVVPEVFKKVLYFCYGGGIKEEELAANAKAIIEAADRFGVVNLKLQAEAVLTGQTEITVDNMLDNLLYANSKNLALFQEKIMDFVAENGSKIVGKVSFDDVPSSLISDILTAFAQGKKSNGEAAPEDDLAFTRVSELRRRLHEKGLCFDGSIGRTLSVLEMKVFEESMDASVMTIKVAEERIESMIESLGKFGWLSPSQNSLRDMFNLVPSMPCKGIS